MSIKNLFRAAVATTVILNSLDTKAQVPTERNDSSNIQGQLPIDSTLNKPINGFYIADILRNPMLEKYKITYMRKNGPDIAQADFFITNQNHDSLLEVPEIDDIVYRKTTIMNGDTTVISFIATDKDLTIVTYKNRHATHEQITDSSQLEAYKEEAKFKVLGVKPKEKLLQKQDFKRL